MHLPGTGTTLKVFLGRGTVKPVKLLGIREEAEEEARAAGLPRRAVVFTTWPSCDKMVDSPASSQWLIVHHPLYRQISQAVAVRVGVDI